MGIHINPSILSADFANLQAELENISTADAAHIDVMDNHFVPNLTWGLPVVKRLREVSPVPFDVHLMISEPDKYIEDFVKAGADLISVHAETVIHLHRTIQSIKALGVKSGVAINPATSLSTLEYILPDLDLVLLMSVNPGFGGQKFIDITKKIEKLCQMCAEYGVSPYIEIDGGITAQTAPLVAKAGANVLVAGSAVFGKENRKEAIAALKNAVK